MDLSYCVRELRGVNAAGKSRAASGGTSMERKTLRDRGSLRQKNLAPLTIEIRVRCVGNASELRKGIAHGLRINRVAFDAPSCYKRRGIAPPESEFPMD